MIEDFLRAVDVECRGLTPEPVTLQVLGSVALMLQFDYRRTTKDGDVFETVQLRAAIKDQLRAIAERDIYLVDETDIELPSWI